MILRKSALKHKISEADTLAAASDPEIAMYLDEEHPQRQLRLGFDTRGRLLETVVLIWDDGTEEVIHSMKARKKYIDFLG
ncbi:MAG: hypothetical protein KF916_05050 [Microbacteriaceae bacterium]|nr:hypothetical protein [Microbacteriaceae bacterium]